MADFTESMKGFTDRLKSSIDDRGASLTSVHQATIDLLGGARDFLANVAEEHGARADEVHTMMSTSRSNRLATVKAMRDSHCESLAAMSAEMNRTLAEATRSRVEEVNAFMSASHADRTEKSKAMRDSHREELATMGEDLRHTLDEANKGRLEAVGMMRDTFKAAQQALASDLRDSAKAWSDFASSRNVAPAHEPKAKVHVEAKKPTTAVHAEATKPKQAAHRNAKSKVSHAR